VTFMDLQRQSGKFWIHPRTSQVEHSIETGDARPIKRNPYRIPYALKSVVDEHIYEMLKKRIIESSTSP